MAECTKHSAISYKYRHAGTKNRYIAKKALDEFGHIVYNPIIILLITNLIP